MELLLEPLAECSRTSFLGLLGPLPAAPVVDDDTLRSRAQSRLRRGARVVERARKPNPQDRWRGKGSNSAKIIHCPGLLRKKLSFSPGLGPRLFQGFGFDQPRSAWIEVASKYWRGQACGLPAAAAVYLRSTMVNSTSVPAASNFNIQGSSLDPSATHYLLFGQNDDLHADAYVLDFNDVPRPHVSCVVLFPCDRGWPGYMYAPPTSLEGVPHEEVIRLAVAAYALHHQDLIGVLRLHPTEGDVGNAAVFDGR